MKLLVKNGRLIDPVHDKDAICDIFVKDGYIEKIAYKDDLSKEEDTAGDAEILDADGCIIFPELFDMHVHLREPGFEASEEIETGTLAALRGGFSGVACMPNTNPRADNSSVIRSITNTAKEKGAADVKPIGCITKNSQGEELTEMADMLSAGIVAVSDDGSPVINSAVMRNALLYAKALDLTVISHCEELSLSSGGAMNEGYVSTVLGLKGIPASAEEVIVFRDALLAEEVGAKLHIAHVSTAGSVEIVRRAKERGARISCEVTPHHFSLTEEAVKGYDTNTKVNPPLRTQADVEAVIEGLKDGTIDAIATDHAPHAEESKMMEYDYAPFGISGLETALPLIVSNLILPGHLTWKQAAEKLTKAPSGILGIETGSIKEKVPAKFTVINIDKSRKVDVSSFRSKGKNSPFKGIELKGWPVISINGDWVYDNRSEELISLKEGRR